MSKEIDFEKPLSDEDREWLHERSLDHLVQANDRQFAKEPEEAEVNEEEGSQQFVTTGAKTSWEPGTEPVQQFAQRPYDPPLSGAFKPGPVVGEEDVAGKEGSGVEAEDDLDTWTVEELKDELRSHGESTAGNKDELIKRLRKG